MSKKMIISMVTVASTVLVVFGSTSGSVYADEIFTGDVVASTVTDTVSLPSVVDTMSGGSAGTSTGSDDVSNTVDNGSAVVTPATPTDTSSLFNTDGSSSSSDDVSNTVDNGAVTPSTDTSALDSDSSSSSTDETPKSDDIKTDVTTSTTAEQVNNVGQSQIGTTSTVTGQVVQDVTTQAPVTTNSGATIVSTQDGQVVLSDGTVTTPESIGATTNSDSTITVTKSDGTQATLPHTGDEEMLAVSILGMMLSLGAITLAFKDRLKGLVKK